MHLNQMWKLQMVSATVLGLGLAGVGHAAILSGYDFGAASDGTAVTFAATTVAPGVTAGDLTRGAGAAATGTAFANTDIFNHDAFNKPTLNDAMTGNAYYQWSIAPTAGTLSLSGLDYSVYAQNNGTNPANFSGAVYFSLDGFATAGIEVQSFTGVTPRSGANNYLSNPQSADLSGVAALQNVASTVTFRFYGYSGASYTDQGFGRADGNDLQISGTAGAVPEPASLGLLALGGLALLRRRH